MVTKIDKFSSTFNTDIQSLKSSTDLHANKVVENERAVSFISKRVQELELNQNPSASQNINKSIYETDLKHLKNELTSNLNNQVKQLNFVKADDIKTIVGPIIEMYLKEFLAEYTEPTFQVNYYFYLLYFILVCKIY